MLTRMTLSLAFVLAPCLSQPARAQPEHRGRPQEGASHSDIPDNLGWRGVSGEQKERALALLSAQTQGNYEKISTWAGRYLIHQEEYAPASFMKVPFEREHRPAQAVIKARDLIFKFAIDVGSDSIFHDSDTTHFELLSADGARNPVQLAHFGPIDQRSVVTRNDYSYYDYKMKMTTLSLVRTFPEARRRRWGFRVPPERARKQEFGDLIDPRLFFRCAMPATSSRELEIYSSSLRGEKGPDKKAWAESSLMVEAADREGKTWYRLRTRIASGSGGTMITTSVWSPLAGLNPVSLAVAMESGGGRAFTSNTTIWRWKDVEGILVPAFVEEAAYDRDLGGLMSYLRIAELKECSLNKPIPASAFTIKALGLKEGELLADETDQTVYVVDGNGGTTKLAAFNEVYVPPDKRQTAAIRWTLSLSALVLLMAAAALFVHKRMGRAKRGHAASAAS